MCVIALNKAIRNLIRETIEGILDVYTEKGRLRRENSSQILNGCQVKGMDSGLGAEAGRVMTTGGPSQGG